MKLDSEAYMGIVYDSLRLAGEEYPCDYHIDIKPTCGYNKIIHGEAFTTYGMTTANIHKPYEELDKIRLDIYKRKEDFQRNPIVFLESNDKVVAHSGDITSLIYKKLGAKGFVTDGNVRDVDIIDEMGFPTFSEGANPIDAIDYWAITKFQTLINIKGTTIRPRDYAFASRDGVMIIPKEKKEKVFIIIEEELKRENSIRKLIKESNLDIPEILDRLGRW